MELTKRTRLIGLAIGLSALAVFVALAITFIPSALADNAEVPEGAADPVSVGAGDDDVKFGSRTSVDEPSWDIPNAPIPDDSLDANLPTDGEAPASGAFPANGGGVSDGDTPDSVSASDVDANPHLFGSRSSVDELRYDDGQNYPEPDDSLDADLPTDREADAGIPFPSGGEFSAGSEGDLGSGAGVGDASSITPGDGAANFRSRSAVDELRFDDPSAPPPDDSLDADLPRDGEAPASSNAPKGDSDDFGHSDGSGEPRGL